MFNLPEKEKEVLSRWQTQKIFQKTLDKDSPRGEYVFYDGPPFATGTPHYGHIVASIMKDIVPRYYTMRGYHVARKWGWDCHGLPIENIVEKELGLEHKKDIEDLGIKKFNETCESKVMIYADEWRKVMNRLGRWADMDDDYKTMDLSFMESIWWVFKNLWDKGLIYEGYKSMHICPRCETTLSHSEVSQGYEIIKDISAIAKFELVDEPGTFVLAWTTTPWTLPGNVALAVGEDVDYIKVKLDDSFYYLAKENIEKYFEGKSYELVEAVKGKDLAGKKYKPLFPYFDNEKLENRENGFQIYTADFVSTEDGTGVVHIAPAFGEDDMNLGQKENLPFIQHVSPDGRFVDTVVDFAGLEVKPKEDTQKTDVEIIKYLAHNNLLFAKEKYEHSYPHCWRCDTPLLNYATSSWFVDVTKLKDDALKLAENINWTPDHIKAGRFGKWLEGARDWSISRQRFWGSAMPIWACAKCDKKKVIGSLAELRSEAKNKEITRLTFVRHGESEKNIKNLRSSALDKHPLTENGINQARETADKLDPSDYDVIFASPVLRARETAEIIAEKFGKDIIFADELIEFRNGKWEEKTRDELKNDPHYIKYDELRRERREGFFDIKIGETGESRRDITARIQSFIERMSREYAGKNVLVVSHSGINAILGRVIEGFDIGKMLKNESYPYATPRHYYVDEKGEGFDIHKHNIDDIEFKCECGEIMKRIPDVLDCWFESGSMPYASIHYPFENGDRFEDNFPAEFIAEGADQTRAWFYYTHILATGLKEKNAFKNVVVNGIVQAEDGKKMSKKLQNYPDPMLVFDKYGADACRYYLTASPVMRAEDLNFSEKDLVEQTRFINTLANVLSFYKMFADGSEIGGLNYSEDLTNILDRWICARIEKLKDDITKRMDKYDLNAVREIPAFIDDLSTWYVRRSRDRLKGDDELDKTNALKTLRHILLNLALAMAPFMPFLSDHIYHELDGDKESVHLEDWPEVDKRLFDEKILENMTSVRKIVEMGLAKRSEEGIKVRQPLNTIFIQGKKIADEYLFLITDEMNVKNVEFQKSDSSDLIISLDTEITDELHLEGLYRELVRTINQKRKQMNLTIADRVAISWQSDADDFDIVFDQFQSDLEKSVLADKILRQESDGESVKVNGLSIRISVVKV